MQNPGGTHRTSKRTFRQIQVRFIVYFRSLVIRLIYGIAFVGPFYLLNHFGEQWHILGPSGGRYVAFSGICSFIIVMLASSLSARDAWGGTPVQDFLAGTAGAAAPILVPVLTGKLLHGTPLTTPPLELLIGLFVFAAISASFGWIACKARIDHHRHLTMLRSSKVSDLRAMAEIIKPRGTKVSRYKARRS